MVHRIITPGDRLGAEGMDAQFATTLAVGGELQNPIGIVKPIRRDLAEIISSSRFATIATLIRDNDRRLR
jgi:hypothetical protein